MTKNKLESLVKKHKKAGKPIAVGKVVGGIVGIVTGIFVGQEMPELPYINCSDYVLFGIKLSPALLFGYMGQRIGGYMGVIYYFNRVKKSKKK